MGGRGTYTVGNNVKFTYKTIDTKNIFEVDAYEHY